MEMSPNLYMRSRRKEKYTWHPEAAQMLTSTAMKFSVGQKPSQKDNLEQCDPETKRDEAHQVRWWQPEIPALGK
ncbi:rCG32548 [Rattus norvegicus]|uniref:RCG32548 n=1 Tax=Rattus norvegicus TaxID=10116 RepID=A6HDT7_RAT|nr:rCG32548 [Rattus norvegicus]